jgi:tetratricopeptide (TPR) repeat protein
MFRRILAVALLCTPAVTRADWHEASSKHFVVYSEQKPETLRTFATNLERFDKAARVCFSWPDDPVGQANRVTVYVVDDTGDVGRLARNRMVAGFYIPRAGGSLAIVPRKSGAGNLLDFSPQAILLHEYAHHLMWTNLSNSAFPGWFVEGFAELLATAVFNKDGSVLFGSPPLYRGWGLLAGNALPMQKMVVADTLKLNDEQRDGLYGRGWLLTHYLTFGKARAGQLNGYINAINAGKSSLEAASVFGDLRQLDKELERYKEGKFSGGRVEASRLSIGEVAIRKVGPGQAATMDVRIRSKIGVDERTAPGVYAAAKKAADLYPDDPAAQIVLAEAAHDADDTTASEAAADRAIAADPKAIDAWVYKAKARMRAAIKARDKSKETWSAIRKSIVSANRLDPDDPEPLILYFRSYVESGLPPTDAAKHGLVRALELAPEDLMLRLNVATVYLREGNKVAARALLAPLSFQPHDKGLATLATTLITLIDSGKIDDAIRVIDAKPDENPAPDGKKS